MRDEGSKILIERRASSGRRANSRANSPCKPVYFRLARRLNSRRAINLERLRLLPTPRALHLKATTCTLLRAKFPHTSQIPQADSLSRSISIGVGECCEMRTAAGGPPGVPLLHKYLILLRPEIDARRACFEALCPSQVDTSGF